MSFSYSNTLATDKDWVRFLCGDVVEASALLQDEEITAVIAEEVSSGITGQAIKYYAAARVLSSLLSKWAGTGQGIARKTVDDLSIWWQSDGSGSKSIEGRIQELKERGAYLMCPRPRTFKVLYIP